MEVRGAALAADYYRGLVGPALASRWPRLPHAAGRLGSGSDVLGLDDAVSRDHDWGLRLNLWVPGAETGPVADHLDAVLPETFQGHPVRFATTWDPHVRLRVQVETVDAFLWSRTGLPAASTWSVPEWLSLTGQAVLEVTAGPVFVDTAGELAAVRERLTWYPDDLWLHVLATDWIRVAEELPFVGRAAERGDDVGSRVIAARLVGVAMHLGHLLERRWPPYAKWIGTSFGRLPHAGAATAPLLDSLGSGDGRTREATLVEALRLLYGVQRDLGLGRLTDPVEQFWDRPYSGVRDEVAAELESLVTDPEVRALPRGVGSAEQRSDTVAVLMDPRLRRLAVSDSQSDPAAP